MCQCQSQWSINTVWAYLVMCVFVCACVCVYVCVHLSWTFVLFGGASFVVLPVLPHSRLACCAPSLLCLWPSYRLQRDALAGQPGVLMMERQEIYRGICEEMEKSDGSHSSDVPLNTFFFLCGRNTSERG